MAPSQATLARTRVDHVGSLLRPESLKANLLLGYLQMSSGRPEGERPWQAARRMEGAGNHALALQLAHVAQIHEQHVVAAEQSLGFARRHRLDGRPGLLQHLLVTALHVPRPPSPMPASRA